jgi:hypothetical protein
MLRVLRPGGTLIITFTNVRSPYSWWKKYVFYPAVLVYHSVCRGFKPDSPVVLPPDPKGRTLYTKRTACKCLESEGAEVSRILGYYFNVFLSPLDELFPTLALRMTRALEEERWPRPEWLAAGWIIKAKKCGPAVEGAARNS